VSLSTADRGRVIGRHEDTLPLLLLWPPFSNEMTPDLVNGVSGRALVTKLAPLLMEKPPGNQIEHKLFGFFANQLHRHIF
jgi:hypothetical protein